MDWLSEALTGNHYPGRGVLWCRTGDGSTLGAYFLTGRSPASQARALRRTPDGDLAVAPAGSRAHDRLRHYVAARQRGDWLIFGNGEQVATVAERLAGGQPPAPALDGQDYEPDPPIFTPRLTVVADVRDGHRAWLGAADPLTEVRTAAKPAAISSRNCGHRCHHGSGSPQRSSHPAGSPMPTCSKPRRPRSDTSPAPCPQPPPVPCPQRRARHHLTRSGR